MNFKYPCLTIDFLEKEYLYNRKSSVLIANEVECTKRHILRKLKQYNIPRRKVADLNKQRGPLQIGINNPKYVDKINTYCAYCNKKLLLFPSRLKNAINNFCNKTCNAKFRNGDKSPSWKGGISFEPYPLGWNNTYKEQIRYRDSYKCQICDIPEVECCRKLDVHHKDYNKKNIKQDNLISLCRSCHVRTNSNREYWLNYFKKENTEIVSNIL